MTDAQFMGMLIGSIATLLAIISIITAIIVKPIINLNKTITKLNTTIDNIQGEASNLKSRVNVHGQELETAKIKLAEHDTILSYHSEDIKDLKKKA